MSTHDELRRLRRFLRDPEAAVWENDLLRELYNAVQADLQARTGILEAIRALPLPPRYRSSYLFDWEWGFAEEPSHHAGRHQGDDVTFSARFEIQAIAGLGGETSEEGAAFIHPFEAWMGVSVGLHVKQPFPENFHTAKAVYYDEEPIELVERKRVTRADSAWSVRTGEPQLYFRDDEVSNEFVLYPRPTSIGWNDVLPEEDHVVVYSAGWEADEAGDGAALFTAETSTLAYLFPWEENITADQSPWLRGMWLFEAAFGSAGPYGMVLYVAGDSQGAEGTMVACSGRLLSGDLGIAVDVIDAADNLLLIYDVAPTELTSLADEPDWPDYLRRYVRHGTLERAYRAHNDGRIESLSRYWGMRYQLGVEALKAYLAMRKQDRDYRLATKAPSPVRRRRLPRLPAHYPAVNP